MRAQTCFVVGVAKIVSSDPMASGGNSTAISSSSSLVKKFMSDHPHVNYINKEVFCQCYHKIKPWLNISCLQHLFMKYRLVNNSDEMKAISSSYLQASDKSIALVEMIEKGGENGYMIFYICIYESSSGNIGHEDVLNILDSTGEGRCDGRHIQRSQNGAQDII